MNSDAGQIDRIVREVMRQLMAMPSVSNEAASTSVSGTGTQPCMLAVADRVVSTASLDGRLSGVKELRVQRNAVITPSVRDLLRERGIGLERSEFSGTGTVANDAQPRDIHLVLVSDQTRAQQVGAMLQELQVDWQLSQQLDDDTIELVLSTERPGNRVLVLSADWASLSCQTNRNPRLRAASVGTPIAVRQACEQIDVNVLIVDPTRMSRDALCAIVNEYIRSIRSLISSPRKGDGDQAGRAT